ncbi:MAG: hypothetical protein KA271_00460 [Propionivibrio sp.]|nr:hypothetical protein [Propionivibrio sp.]
MTSDSHTLTMLSYRKPDLAVIDRFEDDYGFDALGAVMLLIRWHILQQDANWYLTMRSLLREFYTRLHIWPELKPFATDLIAYIEETYPDGLIEPRRLPRPQTGKLLEQPFSIVVV